MQECKWNFSIKSNIIYYFYIFELAKKERIAINRISEYYYSTKYKKYFIFCGDGFE